MAQATCTNKRNEIPEGIMIACGNPLLDILAVVDESLLQKYNMKPNNAILAEELHTPLKDELIQKYNAEFLAGGSAQNTCRGVQWVIGKSNITTYFGAVGRDKFAEILEKIAKETGVNCHYQYIDDHPTGTCAVLVTGNDRSLCADLAAANHFTIDHLKKPENLKFIEKAQFFYITGFFLTVSPESIMQIANYANCHKKTFIMNLSAPFISRFFKTPLMEAFPFVDIIFGNEEEAAAFGEEQQLGTTNLNQIALKMCNLPKKNPDVPRIVIITRGPDPIIYATKGEVKEIPAITLEKGEIIDSNGAGDAFTGGFLAYYIQNRPIEECIQCGINVATQVLKQPGCTYVGKFTS